jgi:Xaa-Pro aminopeptidase
VEREIWDGLRLGPEQAISQLGVDHAYPFLEVNERLPNLMANYQHLYSRLGASADVDTSLRTWLNALNSQVRQGVKKPTQFHDLEAIVHEYRLVKDAEEIAIMRRAGQISAQAHLAAMSASQAGLKEYDLEAEILYTFRKAGSESVAYNSIVAAGENACILHYRASDATLQDGDLCLIDAGCELAGYASDITRTFPINGKFSAAQQEAYEIVLAAQAAAIAQCQVGKNFLEPHEAALEILTQGLFDMKILQHHLHGSTAEAIHAKLYQPYYMHRTSHWLGMDVHDVGSYREPSDPNQGWRIFQPGMVLTVEPGLYFRPSPEVPEKYWNIGIRIEDDVLIQDTNPEILSRDVPVSVSEIERWMS